MVIFLKNIPEHTRPRELFNHVNPALKGGLFFQTGKILKTELVYIRDQQSNRHECHGLVHVDVDSAGGRAIKKLSGKPFKTVQITLREYVKRDEQNDRREGGKIPPSGVREQRRRDRRRGDSIEIIRDCYHFFSVDGV